MLLLLLLFALGIQWICTLFSGVGNAAAAAALAAAPFRPKLCGKASSEPYISAAVGKGSTTPVIEYQRVVGELLLFSAAIVFRS